MIFECFLEVQDVNCDVKSRTVTSIFCKSTSVILVAVCICNRHLKCSSFCKYQWWKWNDVNTCNLRFERHDNRRNSDWFMLSFILDRTHSEYALNFIFYSRHDSLSHLSRWLRESFSSSNLIQLAKSSVSQSINHLSRTSTRCSLMKNFRWRRL